MDDHHHSDRQSDSTTAIFIVVVLGLLIVIAGGLASLAFAVYRGREAAARVTVESNLRQMQPLPHEIERCPLPFVL